MEPEAGDLTSFVEKVLRHALTVKGFGYVCAVFGTITLYATARKYGLSSATLTLGVVLFIALAVLFFIVSRVTQLSSNLTSLPT
jgi:hypothetical protein